MLGSVSGGGARVLMCEIAICNVRHSCMQILGAWFLLSRFSRPSPSSPAPLISSASLFNLSTPSSLPLLAYLPPRVSQYRYILISNLCFFCAWIVYEHLFYLFFPTHFSPSWHLILFIVKLTKPKLSLTIPHLFHLLCPLPF